MGTIQLAGFTLTKDEWGELAGLLDGLVDVEEVERELFPYDMYEVCLEPIAGLESS
jgi:hypothetical protein